MALRSAHQAGVIHRDLKPSNVFGEPENGIRLGDFGIAVARTASARSEKSSAGTLPFMAPEQLRGSDEIGRFTDVWGAAATACDLRYGRSPFDSVGQILDEQVPPALPPPASPAEAYFQDVLRRMLAKNWQERPQDILGPLAHFTMLARAIEPATLLTSRHRDSIQLGPTRVKFVVGDIADAEADAIVSSANFEMKMRSGVSEALRLRGGDELEEDAASGGEQALGTCLRTTPGKLKTKHLFHAVSAWNEVSCVGRSFTRALLLAEENSCATVAAPALGTGVARVGLEACANAMMTTLRWHLMLGGSRLRELTVVLYTEEKRRLFQEVAEEVLGISRWRHLPADLGLPDDRSVIPDGTSPTFLDPHQV
jgi:serine/threonine-protein kinase